MYTFECLLKKGRAIAEHLKILHACDICGDSNYEVDCTGHNLEDLHVYRFCEEERRDGYNGE